MGFIRLFRTYLKKVHTQNIGSLVQMEKETETDRDRDRKQIELSFGLGAGYGWGPTNYLTLFVCR